MMIGDGLFILRFDLCSDSAIGFESIDELGISPLDLLLIAT